VCVGGVGAWGCCGVRVGGRGGGGGWGGVGGGGSTQQLSASSRHTHDVNGLDNRMLRYLRNGIHTKFHNG